MTPRIPPKTGNVFRAGNIMRIELPAQGYMNPANTTLEFDVTLAGVGTADLDYSFTRFQNNIQSIFQRVRWLYGSMVGEDMIDYNQWVRCLTEWTSTNQVGTMDQTAISDGLGGITYGAEGKSKGDSWVLPRQGLVNVRQAYIQGLDNTLNTMNAANTVTTAVTTYLDISTSILKGSGFGQVPNDKKASGASFDSQYTKFSTRRYQVNLALGILSQDKYLPLKWMASQFALEFTFEQDAGCLFSFGTNIVTPTYQVSNVNLIPEIVEFDEEYDATFLQGLQQGGVPIKFASIHTYIFSTGGASNLNLQIQERSRSVKALFAIQRRTPYDMGTDSGATFLCSVSDLTASDNAATLQKYQWRIGGRYFPGAPVELSSTAGSSIPNGGCEAWLELQKALNIVGDYRLSTSCNTLRWGLAPYKQAPSTTKAGVASTLSEFDYLTDIIGWTTNGQPMSARISDSSSTVGNTFHGNVGSACFAMAIDLETSSGVEISGLNAEEQSDISLIATYSSAQNSNFIIEVFAYFDMMLILRENNQVELIY